MDGMECKICHISSKIVGYDHGDPYLECGHLQTDDHDLLMVELANSENEKQIKKLMKEKGISREQAQDTIIDTLFKDMPVDDAKKTIELLESQNLKCDILNKIKQDLEQQ